MSAGVDQRDEIISEVSVSSELSLEVTETDKIIPGLSDRKGLRQEASETDEIITGVPERNVLARDVYEADETTREMPERNGLVHEVSETDETASEMPERSEATRAEANGSRAIRDTSHSDAISRTISHSMYQYTLSCKFSVYDIEEKESFRFQAHYDTEFKAGPTSWLCEMLFERVAVDGTFCIIFKFKRTDSAGDTVKLNVSLDVKDATAMPLFCIPSIQRHVVGSGQIIDLYLLKKIRTPEEVFCFSFKLDVRVDVPASFCHLEQDLGRECQIL